MDSSVTSDLVEALGARVDALEATVRALAAENAALRAAAGDRRPAAHRPDAPSRTAGVTRRAVLRGAGLTAAGAVAATVASAAPAAADTGPMQFGTNNDAGEDTTYLSSAANPTLAVYQIHSAGDALYCETQDAGAGGAALRTHHLGSGPSLRATHAGSGHALWASLGNAANLKAALLATTAGSGPGVSGKSAKGRGGQFQGKVANVRLVPGGATTHPASGAAGDLVVDASGRLWYCKGATAWKQLA